MGETRRKNGRGGIRVAATGLTAFLAIAWLNLYSGSAVAAANEPGTPKSPQEFYNDGTQKLSQGKLPEAEAALQNAVASQDEKVQVPALFNLGHARFQQGVKDLKNGPDGKAAQATAGHASETTDEAMHAADEALAGTDVDAIVAAYMQGRGARKDLKSATEAVKRALESMSAVLTKWQRASGDFKSAHELRPGETDAQFNADVVDRYIAKLVDMQRLMMQALAAMGKQRQELRRKMQELKKKMPGDPGKQFQGGKDDDDDDDEDNGKKPEDLKAGMQEGPTKEGKQMEMSYEQAGRLLDMLKLDSNHKLPLGGTETGTPDDRKRRDW